MQPTTYDVISIEKSKALKLSGTNIRWDTLKRKRINNKVVILGEFGDIHPFKNGPIFMAEKVYIEWCDKNFIYYWIDETTFPNAKEVYLMSHPCEPETLWRDFDHIYLTEQFWQYKERWAKDHDNITMMKKQVIKDRIASYEKEELISEDIPAVDDGENYLVQ